MAYPSTLDELTDRVPSDGAAPSTPLGDPTYPLDDWARAISAAVEAIETELGLAPSGAADDLAARLTSLDTTVAAKVAKSLAEAKGDLIVATAAATLARLAVGTNGQVLTADSASAGGMKWATASGGGGSGELAGPVFASGKYAAWSGSIDTRTLNEDRGFYVPIVPDRDLTVDRIGLEITGTATGTPLVRLGIYDDADGVPGARVLDAGTINGASASYQEITISQALTGGARYWLTVAQQGGTSNGSCRATRYATSVSLPSSGYTPYEAGAWMDADALTGALPSSAPSMNDVSAAAPRILLRVA